MKIAITGGAGFVGSHIAKAYLDAGHDVLIVDNLTSGSRQALDPRARFYALDIRDSRLLDVLSQERPDVVSHHAVQRPSGLPAEWALRDADVHIRGLLNVLEACVTASVRKVIFASGGDSLYGIIPMVGADIHIAKEDATLCPSTPFDISKVSGEAYVRYFAQQYGFDYTILRYASIYGETDDAKAQHPVTHCISMLAENRRPTLRGSIHEVRDHIFIDDVARANLLALTRGRNSTLHISSGQGYSLHQFFCAVAQYFQSDLLPIHVSDTLVGPAACILDNTLARQELGWKPEIGLSEGIRLTIERMPGVMKRDEQEKDTVSEQVLQAVFA
ncbi:MAG TPA: NAD-dependent epimerase/dehydratase family protein [Ktedonobacteraceae bacterium]|jgi:UDP-glucose 4-epimerase|nr:NAD-dependent epimerase/dehydratase family protein [Ktedonobacteraceae bacterium]